MPPGNLHITLAFLGSRPAGDLPTILRVLEDAVRAAAAPSFEVVRWRERRAAGMLELRDSTGTTAARLAGRVQAELVDLGLYRLENRDWLPHVTVLRYRDPPRLSPPLPELGPVAAVRGGCLPIPSAPVRGGLRGARIVSTEIAEQQGG